MGEKGRYIKDFYKTKIEKRCYFSPWFEKMLQNRHLEKWWDQV